MASLAEGKEIRMQREDLNHVPLIKNGSITPGMAFQWLNKHISNLTDGQRIKTATICCEIIRSKALCNIFYNILFFFSQQPYQVLLLVPFYTGQPEFERCAVTCWKLTHGWWEAYLKLESTSTWCQMLFWPIRPANSKTLLVDGTVRTAERRLRFMVFWFIYFPFIRDNDSFLRAIGWVRR